MERGKKRTVRVQAEKYEHCEEIVLTAARMHTVASGPWPLKRRAVQCQATAVDTCQDGPGAVRTRKRRRSVVGVLDSNSRQ